MTKQEILNRLERIRDGLSDTNNRWGVEGTIQDINDLMVDIKLIDMKG